MANAVAPHRGAEGRPEAPPRARPGARADPEPSEPGSGEPVWLVRIVLLLFLVGFAMFLGQEAYRFVESLTASS